MSLQPEHVTRFYSNTDYALECIALKQITFIHVDKMNDPFDPIPYFIKDFKDYESLVVSVQTHHPLEVESFKKILSKRHFKDMMGGFLKYLEEIRSKMFVFSTSAVFKDKYPRDNLYMWGHYGNGHRGVAIEFNFKVLVESLPKNTDLYSWAEIEYDEVPRIKAEDMFKAVMDSQSDSNRLESYEAGVGKAIKTQLMSKGYVWRKEKEWRLIWLNNETKLHILRYDLPDEAISSVYLGCRLADNEKAQDDFIYETKRQFPKAKLFKAIMKHGKYALSFEEIP